MTSPATPCRPVAVIDLGSNSIKLLVAARDPSGSLIALTERTDETRIGAGIAGNPPRLAEEAMDRAVAAVARLLREARTSEPGALQIVATSAVREAVNRGELVERIRRATNEPLRVLDGLDEARLVGRGIGCDPALRGMSDFYLTDLGGGSLELVQFRERQPVQMRSLPLGCVRMTGLTTTDPSLPLSEESIAHLRALVRTTVEASGFRFDLAPPARAVVTGGTATTVRAIAAAASGRQVGETDPLLRVADLEALGLRLAKQDLPGRRRLAGLPAARADVFPTALLTLAEVGRLAGIHAFQHSFHNLRYGVAVELLESSAPAGA